MREQHDIRRATNAADQQVGRPERSPDVHDRMYFNSNGGAIAIVAVKVRIRHSNECMIASGVECGCGGIQTWSAYIASTVHCYYEEDAINFARSFGDPLPEDIARAIFPRLKDWQWEGE